jgi:TetR/AcrR family transcriptional regulator, copper-responsive repressor
MPEKAQFKTGLDRRWGSGCPIMCTAPAEALEEPLAQAALARVIGILDRAYEARFQTAKSAGEIAETADPRVLALQATALLQSLALCARSGSNAAGLSEIARSIIVHLAWGDNH